MKPKYNITTREQPQELTTEQQEKLPKGAFLSFADFARKMIEADPDYIQIGPRTSSNQP